MCGPIGLSIVVHHLSCLEIMAWLHLARPCCSHRSSGGIPFPLLDLLQRLHGAVQGMSVISPELGVCAFEGGVAVGFGFLDPVEWQR